MLEELSGRPLAVDIGCGDSGVRFGLEWALEMVRDRLQSLLLSAVMAGGRRAWASQH